MNPYILLLLPVSYFLYKYALPGHKKPSKGRKMGLLERYYDFLHNHARYKCFIICAKMNGKTLNDDELRNIIMRVSYKHPLIKHCINYDYGSPYLIPIDDLKNKFFIKRHVRLSDDTWKDIANEEMYTGFNANEPLFRVNLITNDDGGDWELVLSLHHSIFDGRSGANFLEFILEEYDNPSNGEIINDSLPPTVEEVIDISPSYSTVFSTLTYTLLPFLKKKSEAWIYPENMVHVNIENRSASTIYFSIDSNIVSLLRDKCRFYKTTVTSAIFAAISHSLVDILNEEKKVFSYIVPFDLRKHSNPILPTSTIGAYVSPSEFELQIEKNNDFWSDSLLIKQNINLYFKEGLQSLGMIKYGLVFDSFALKSRLNNMPNGRLTTICVSNLGSLKFKEKYKSNKFKDIWFTQLKIGDGPTFHFSSVTLENGNLNITLDYLDDPAITEIANKLCPKVKQLLIKKATE